MNTNVLMAERTNLPRTGDAPRRLAADERSATQRAGENGGGAMRTNRALTAEGRAARADRDSEAVTKLNGCETRRPVHGRDVFG
jgi:hypothetical protein